MSWRKAKEPKTLRTWVFPSKSTRGVAHRVALRSDGEYSCDCVGFLYAKSGKCRHIRQLRHARDLITYNHEQYIAHAIESVLAQQTDFPFEILISEDYSTDSTRDILSKYQQRFPEQIQLFLSNCNQSDNQVMTRALLGAKGQYIAILEGDDYWTSTNKL